MKRIGAIIGRDALAVLFAVSMLCGTAASGPTAAHAQDATASSVATSVAPAKAKKTAKASRKAKAAAKATGSTPPAAPGDKSLLESAHLRASPGEMPDFVRNSRPSEDKLTYVPLGGARPEPTDKPMTRDEIKKRESELDGIRGRLDRVGGREPAAAATRSVAGDPYVPKAKKPKAPCLLTCTIETSVTSKTK